MNSTPLSFKSAILKALFVFGVISGCMLVTPENLFSFQQNDATKISGTITDGLTGDPLEGVNVYLSYTTYGDATDSNGYFSFSTNLTGQYELVVSAVGFDAKRYIITLGSEREELRIDLEMLSHSVELNEIEVKADNTEWVQNFELFEREFLGTTNIAQDASILNRWVLNFDRNEDGELIAYADDPIKISNPSLGYNLTADLNEFVWNTSDMSGFYRVKVWFEEQIPDSEEEYQRWQSNRAQVYEGSFRHFLKSLYDDKLFRNQFEIVWQDTRERARLKKLDEEELEAALMSRNLDEELISKNIKGYHLLEPVDVLIGRRSIRSDVRERARLIPMLNDESFLITPEGNLADLMSVATAGYWSAMRMADMVPIDYQP
jgi:hypothetical protein